MIPRTRPRRTKVAGSAGARAALLALALLMLAGGLFALALAPAPVDAQTSPAEPGLDSMGVFRFGTNTDGEGYWHAKVGDTAICPPQNAVEADAGSYSKTSATTITMRLMNFPITACAASNVLTANDNNGESGAVTWHTGNSDAETSWYMQLRSGTGETGGSLITDGDITLPSSFSGARAVANTKYNSRNGTDDGNWPTVDGNTDRTMRSAEISFTVPSTQTGDVYLFVKAAFIRSDIGGYVWQPFSFKFVESEVDAHPLVVPLDSSGDPATGDVSVPSPRPAGGTSQRARLLLRAADPEAAYHAADANATRADFGSATLKIASDADGSTAISGATITQSDGSSAIAACTEATAGNTCTVTSSNWPQGSAALPRRPPARSTSTSKSPPPIPAAPTSC